MRLKPDKSGYIEEKTTGEKKFQQKTLHFLVVSPFFHVHSCEPFYKNPHNYEEVCDEVA